MHFEILITMKHFEHETISPSVLFSLSFPVIYVSEETFCSKRVNYICARQVSQLSSTQFQFFFSLETYLFFATKVFSLRIFFARNGALLQCG